MKHAPPVSLLVDADGRPMPAPSDACPRCGAGRDVRVPSAGFGAPHPVCSQCGYEWIGEPWVPLQEAR